MPWKSVFGRNLSVLFIILLGSTVFAQKLPFRVNGSAWKNYKLTDSLFSSGRLAEAAKAYSRCGEVTRYFPRELYKFALTLWISGDTSKARIVFGKALDTGLKFEDPQTLGLSPLLPELSGSRDRYNRLYQTTRYEQAAEGTPEYKLLLELKEVDRHFRAQRVIDTMALNRADSLNRELFKPLLGIWNWPGIREVGYKGENAAFLIALHADQDLSFQLECLKRMEREFYKGNISISSYAMLIDRYLVNTRQKQLFGTQVVLNRQTGKVESFPLLYPKDVESLRNLFELGPMKL